MKRTSTTCRKAAGFAIIPVVAVFAVLLVLVLSLAFLSTTHHAGAALDLQGVRAYHAARGGLEWALFQVLQNGQDCAGIGGRTLDFADNLAGLHATVQCNASTHAEAGVNVTLFEITSNGCNETTCPTAAVPPAATYVDRQLRVTVARP
jgi:MSHA biogenesis protein MshP